MHIPITEECLIYNWRQYGCEWWNFQSKTRKCINYTLAAIIIMFSCVWRCLDLKCKFCYYPQVFVFISIYSSVLFCFLFFQLFRWINFYFHIFWMLKSVYFPPAPCYYLPLGQINSRRSYEYSNLMVVYFWKYLTQSPIYLKNYFPVSSISLWYH